MFRGISEAIRYSISVERSKKKRLYISSIRPIVRYETWSIWKIDESGRLVFLQENPEKIFGALNHTVADD